MKMQFELCTPLGVDRPCLLRPAIYAAIAVLQINQYTPQSLPLRERVENQPSTFSKARYIGQYTKIRAPTLRADTLIGR